MTPASTANETITPEQIMQVGLGFWGAKTLLNAVGTELFLPVRRQAMLRHLDLDGQ